MLNNSLFSSNSDDWSTPLDFYNYLDSKFHFTLDPCSSFLNHKCDKFFTISDNGLNKDWSGEIVFCNPPYSKIKDWAKKCFYEFINNRVFIVLLIPSRTDTSYFHDYILPCSDIYFVKGRLHFNDKGSAPFPSMVCIMDPNSKGHKIVNYSIFK